MKSLFYFLMFVVLLVSFSGCNNTNNNNVNEAWRTANINAYDSIAKRSDYHALQTASGPTGVYYKIIKSGTGTVYPLQTSDVKILYQVTYYDGTVFDAGTKYSEAPIKIPVYDANGYKDGFGYGPIYYGLYKIETPRGFSFALQHMVAGDKWEIWIPYYLAHGANGSYTTTGTTVVQGYTTLIFTVELISITEYPESS